MGTLQERGRSAPLREPCGKIREFGLAGYSESELNELKPIFVSRRPDRGATGAAHKDTIYSAKYLNDNPPRIVVKKR